MELDEAKQHLRVGFDSDDVYIQSLIDAAADYVQVIGVGIDSPPQPSVVHAMKLLISHWYGNRDAAGTEPSRAIAFGVDALLAPYREWTI
jgi:uncharacterized phage protein (predicted DNA packaging)